MDNRAKVFAVARGSNLARAPSRSSFHSSQEMLLLHAEGMGWRGCAITGVAALFAHRRSVSETTRVACECAFSSQPPDNHSNKVHFTPCPIAY
jgi:hypothetical protein